MTEDWAIPAWPPVAIPVVAGGQFPVRGIYCVGRNYAEHAREMGADPDREPPFFFRKQPEHVVPGGGNIAYPSHTKEFHHEVELVVALGRGGDNIKESQARDLIFGYAVGIDFTRRDLQAEAKSMRRPWDLSKSFPAAAPIGALQPASSIGHPRSGRITLTVNDVPRQTGDINQMIWGIEETIAILSTYQPLLPGDLIFTGTPAGVGTLEPGNQALGEIDGVGTVEITVS